MSNKKHRYKGPTPRKLTQSEIVDRIQRNGITLSDMRKNWQLGYEQGKKEGVDFGYDVAYGSVILALRREFGFGHDRLGRVAMAAAAVQMEYFSNDDLYDELKAECGLELPRMREIAEKGWIGETGPESGC